MIITVGGMIGLGKSSVAKILGEAFGTEVFYEKVEGNRVLEKFYTASEEEIQAKRYPFLLQLEFLSSRFRSIKKALVHDNNVLDRSIFEDIYFAERNNQLGRISDLELELYREISVEMLEELDGFPKKRPDLMVYLTGSFDTVLSRIHKRGRDYELDPDLVEYYRFIWEGYDEWVNNCYDASQVITIDMDKFDIVNNPEDAEVVISMVKEKLNEIRG